MLNEKYRKFRIAFTFLLLGSAIYAQDVVSFFVDSQDPSYYDTGLAFYTPPSSLEQAGPSGFMDKIPVSTDPKYSGANSLRLNWSSLQGGDWSALAIAPGWIFQDISELDTLSFWLFSEDEIESTQLPLIFMEGAPGATKSNKVPLSGFMPEGIAANEWIRATIPLTTFFDDPAQTNIDFTQIKAIIFGQDQADEIPHTLYIDDIIAYAGNIFSELPIPTGLEATGAYERHVELNWNPLTGTNLSGYNIYRSVNNGNDFEFLKFVDLNESRCIAWTGDAGTDQNFQFKMSSVNFLGSESSLSTAISVSTSTMSDEDFLDMVQEYTFRYFWDFAHPGSGMSRERSNLNNADLVTTGGTGFGIMAILVGIERGYITRAEGRQRILQIVNTLESAESFHGVFPHWMNGSTGAVIPFSQYDDGGDLVESSFLFEGLLTAKAYFNENQTDENLLRNKISTLWTAIEWEWYRQGGQDVLYWHWSPNHNWQINLPIKGFHEGHIIYILATAGNPNIAHLYHDGWAGDSNYTNGGIFYGYPLEVGKNFGGPLFFSHYSYIGFDPRGKKDQYTNYFNRNIYHTLINRAYCIDNPGGYVGYSDVCWGLTASYDPNGYAAHQPSNDNGTITPTASLSSIPYTPQYSLDAIKHFYRNHGAQLWGWMGFYDAFNLEENWFSDAYLAIDQGPIICMIENYRTGLLWDKFMSNPEIQVAVNLLGFVEDEDINVGVKETETSGLGEITVYPVPNKGQLYIQLDLPKAIPVKVECFNNMGQLIQQMEYKSLSNGKNVLEFRPKINCPTGIYYFKITTLFGSKTEKVIFN